MEFCILQFTHHRRNGIHDFLGSGEVNALGVCKVGSLELAEHRVVSGGGGLAASRARQTRHAAEVYGLRICQRTIHMMMFYCWVLSENETNLQWRSRCPSRTERSAFFVDPNNLGWSPRPLLHVIPLQRAEP